MNVALLVSKGFCGWSIVVQVHIKLRCSGSDFVLYPLTPFSKSIFELESSHGIVVTIV